MEMIIIKVICQVIKSELTNFLNFFKNFKIFEFLGHISDDFFNSNKINNPLNNDFSNKIDLNSPEKNIKNPDYDNVSPGSASSGIFFYIIYS